MLVEPIENGIETKKRKQQEFFALAERFRHEKNPETAKRLGEQLGQMVFGGRCRRSSVGSIFPRQSGSI
jgi:hypothetical protein